MKTPFVPMEFPIKNEYICLNDFVNEIALASQNIGELNQKMLETKVGFTYSVNHMMKLESLYSTRIEGTQTTINAVYEANLDTKEKKTADVEEVIRYSEALSMASKEVVNSPITIKLIKEAHKILLEGNIRKNSNFVAGNFRTQQNMVGEHIPPVASDVEKLMRNLERYINNDYKFEDNLPPIVKAALIHAQFETIHPFPDGNGRVGRVLIPIYLYKQGVIASPYFFLSQELEKNKIRYYSYLQSTRTLTVKGYSDWIKFFLQSIINQTKNDIDFITKLDALYTRVNEIMRMNINTTNTEIVVQGIFKNPVFTIDSIYRETGINKNTLRKYMGILKDHQILFKDERKRNSRFFFLELLDLMQ